MDVQPAHPNRDSLRDSFKGFVALKIIIDLRFGFSNKQHYLSVLYGFVVLPLLASDIECDELLHCTFSIQLSF